MGTESTRPLVLGLGNPGEEYEWTRHNIGFMVVEELAERHGVERWRLECNALVGELDGVLLAMPQTYMNRSGAAARCLAERRRLEPESILVVIDDVHLPLGTLRLRRKGSPGGHRGLESTMERLETDLVPRLRLGVREGEKTPEGGALVEYVLSPFPSASREEVENMVGRAADACESWAEHGVEETMNRFNG